MAAQNRATLFNKCLRTLKKTYEPQVPSTTRSVFEQVIFGTCLENASLQTAEDSYLRLTEDYLDWNELRVSSPRELAESFSNQEAPLEKARTLKSIIHAIFETEYNFELETLTRMTQTQAAKTLNSFNGMRPFIASHILQTSLKAHVIPLDTISIRAVTRLGLVDTNASIDKMNGNLKRLVSKNQGPLFCSLIRQLALDVCVADTPAIRKCALADICPTAIEIETEKQAPPTKTKKGTAKKKPKPKATRKRK